MSARAPLLERRAVAAAAAAASACGIAFDEAIVVHAGSNVLVRLTATPVVARVMTGTVALHDDPRRWLARELAVLGFLAPAGVAVTPSRALDPGPHCRFGLWVTFVEWVPDVASAPGYRDGVPEELARDFGRELRDLHERLQPFEGDLGGPRDLRRDIERLLGRITPVGAHQHRTVRSLGAQLAALGPAVFESSLPDQALHGDVSLRNVLRTPRGSLWNDFEDTFRGPVHWDVASAVGSLRLHGAEPRAVRALLDAYGWDDERGLAPFIAAQDVYGEIWRLYVRQLRAQRPIA